MVILSNVSGLVPMADGVSDFRKHLTDLGMRSRIERRINADGSQRREEGVDFVLQTPDAFTAFCEFPVVSTSVRTFISSGVSAHFLFLSRLPSP